MHGYTTHKLRVYSDRSTKKEKKKNANFLEEFETNEKV